MTDTQTIAASASTASATGQKDLKAPFPYFGGKSGAADTVWAAFGRVENYVESRCNGQSQFFGCRPVFFVALLVDQVFSCRARFSASMHWSLNATRCIARCSALLINSKLSRLSFSLFSSLWWTPNPLGSSPFSASHTTCARNLHLFGSEIFTHARCSLLRLCRVLITTVPTGSQFSGFTPASNCPRMFFISEL